MLRRLLRRAVRYAKKLNVNRPFMYELVPTVAEIMQDFYPEVKAKTEFIQRVIKNEEERFHETLHEGESILADVIAKAKAAGSDVIAGEDAFRLYDTYGFPIELTEEYAEEANMTVDHDGFEVEMEKQRERARAARQDVDSMQVQGGVLGELKKHQALLLAMVIFETNSRVIALVQNGQFVDEVQAGEEAQVVLDITPFYAESGGQIADHGYLTAGGVKAFVKDVQKKAPNGQSLHRVIVEEGTLAANAQVRAIIDQANRARVIKKITLQHTCCIRR
ncbi:hypothetical protein GCM10020331_036160 [Ectobacillus funiculus]